MVRPVKTVGAGRGRTHGNRARSTADLAADLLGEPPMNPEHPRIRLTGILLEDDRVLLVKETLRERSRWNLPGGGLEMGETLEEGLRRELREETGLEVHVGELLYVTDRFKSLGRHVVDLCFRVHRVAGTPTEQPAGKDGEVLSEVRMVAVDELPAFGLSEKFAQLVRDGFPGKGSYGGEFHALYG